MYLRGILRNVEGREVFGNVQHWQTSLRRLRSTGCTRPCSWLYRLYFVSSVSQRNSPTEARYRGSKFCPTKKLHRRSSLLVELHKLSYRSKLRFIQRPLASLDNFSRNSLWCKDVQLLFKWKLVCIIFSTRFLLYSKSLTFLYPCKVIINYYVDVDCVL